MDTVKGANLGSVLTAENTEALASRVNQVANMVSQPAGVEPSEPKKVSRPAILLDPSESGSGDDFMLALMVLQQKLGKSKMLATREDIQVAKARNEEEHRKNLDKLAESAKKAEEAEKSGVLQKVFGWIATAISVVVAAVITVATIGAGAGVGAMIAAGVALATTLASTAIQAANEVQVEVGGVKMGAFSAAIYKAALNNMSKEDASKAAMGSTIAIQIALAIIGMVASFGAAGVGKLGELANKGGQIAAKLSTSVTQGLKQAGTAMNVVSGVNTVASSAAGIHTSVKTSEAKDIEADRLDIKAAIKEQEALQQQLQEKLKQMMEEMQSIFQTIMQILSGNADTATSIVRRSMI